MTINVVEKIDDAVQLNTILVSVSDKTGLSQFIPGLLDINPQINILSTGGTFGHIKEILGASADKHLTQVADYTGQPETQGGLVKTLDFKIYLGLLTESFNPAHQEDLRRTGARAIDMVVVNLYPFDQTIAKAGVTPEQARGNIDIGGPCMLRASAKNYIRVAPVVDPNDYSDLLTALRHSHGCTTLELRYRLACKAFEHTALYDRTISDYLSSRAFDEIKRSYSF